MRIKKVIFAALAAFTFAAFFAATASAENTLLALWLWNGTEVTELLSVEVKGSTLLEDTKTVAGAVAVLCTATADGSVGSNGEDETTEILNALSEKIGTTLGGLALLGTGAGSGEGSECKAVKACAEGTTSSPIEVTLLGLPWHSLLFQDETSGLALDLLFGATEIGYEVLCLILGVNAEDKCTAPNDDFEVEVLNEIEGAAIPANAGTSPMALCSQSGEETGKNIADELTLIKPLEGLLSIAGGEVEEEAVSLRAEPNPLVFLLSSPNEETIKLTAVGGAGDELEIIAGGVGAIKITKGPAGWVQLSGASCESKVLTVGGAACTEKIKLVKFPPVGERWEAEYEITWRSIKPARIILYSTIVRIKAEN